MPFGCGVHLELALQGNGNESCVMRGRVQGLAAELGIRLLFLPPYSPNLNLIERLWGFAKRQNVYGKYQANFASFRAAIEATFASLSTTHANQLKTLMTLTFQEFDGVSLMTE